MRYFIIGLMAASLLVAGCAKKHKHDSKSDHDHSMKAQKAMDGDHMGHDHMGQDHMGHDHSMKAAMAGGGKVTVSKTGQAYKPPVKKAQIPAGAWICDMGTVHYARGEKGDGICPLCKMKLKKLAAK
jgi:hypothetical protein